MSCAIQCEAATQADVVVTFNERDSRSFFRNTRASIADLLEARQYLLTQASIEEMVAIPKYIPPERHKTLIAFLFTIFGTLVTATSLSFVHELVPDTDPLPDMLLSNIRYVPWALDVCEYLLLVSFAVALLAAVLHKYRWIVLRRICFLIGLLFTYRAITILVTALPNPNPAYFCMPKMNSSITPNVIVSRVIRLAKGGGFSINGDHVYCGDYIFSGHTAMFTLTFLIIREYTSPSLPVLHWCSCCVSVTGVILLVLSHGHYSVDIVIGYWITSRLWWMYHTLANFQTQKLHGYMTNAWWWHLFRFFESQVPRSLPYEFDWPLQANHLMSMARPCLPLRRGFNAFYSRILHSGSSGNS